MAGVMTRSPHAVRRSAVRSRRLWWQVLVLGGMVALWSLAATLIDNPARLPNPLRIPSYAWPLIQSGELGGHILASLRRIALGYGAAVVIGTAIGIAMGTMRQVDALLDAPIEMLRPIPALALLPVLLMVVGIGDVLSVSIVFYASVFPIIINTVAGFREVDAGYVEAAMTMGARRLAIIREVLLPAALPSIMSGLRIAFQFAWMSIVGAELIGALTGLGFMILYYAKFMATERVIVGMVTIGLLGLVFDRVLLIIWRLMTPWASH